MIRVELLQSPPVDLRLNGWFDAPDVFRPVVGDRLQFDLMHTDGKPGFHPVDVFVVAVSWRLSFTGNNERGNFDYAAALVLTVASEMPAQATTRRVHQNVKK